MEVFAKDRYDFMPLYPYLWMFQDIDKICLERKCNSAPSNHLSPLYDEFQLIDKIAHVGGPLAKDNPQKQIEKKINLFLQSIILKLKDDYQLDFTLLSCGSVHVGNKVGQFDEMDFILKWNINIHAVKLIDRKLNFEVLHDICTDEVHLMNIKEYLWRL